MSVKPLPASYHNVTPYLTFEAGKGNDAVAFYTAVFGAKERTRLNAPGGRIGHCELLIGDSIIMLSDFDTETVARAAGRPPISIYLYVKNVDEVFARALAAGGIERRPLADQFYGDRTGVFTDPFGHAWNIATHIEDVAPGEIQKRFKEAMGG